MTGGFASLASRNGCGDPRSCGASLTSVAVPLQSAQSPLRVARLARERCFRFQVVEANEFLSLWTLWVVRQVNWAFTWGHCRPSLARSGKRLSLLGLSPALELTDLADMSALGGHCSACRTIPLLFKDLS